jgi:hypothetical protein
MFQKQVTQRIDPCRIEAVMNCDEFAVPCAEGAVWEMRNPQSSVPIINKI